MKVLLDGPDGVGKTTIIRKLVSHYMTELSTPTNPITVKHISDPNHLLGTVIEHDEETIPVSLRDVVLRPWSLGHRFATGVSMGAEGLAMSLGDRTAWPLENPLPSEINRLLILAGEVWTAQRVQQAERECKELGQQSLFFFDRWATSTCVYQAIANPDLVTSASKMSALKVVVQNYLDHISEDFRFDLTIMLLPGNLRGMQQVFERKFGEKDDEQNVFSPSDRSKAWVQFKSRTEGFEGLFCDALDDLGSAGSQFARRFGHIIFIDPSEALDVVYGRVLRYIESTRKGIAHADR